MQQSSIFGIAQIYCFYREFAFYICCILCTCYPLLHPLSNRSGVQKVCKNVQSQNQPLKTGIGFLCKAGKTAGFEPKTAAEISPVQTKHQMYIHNYDSWQGFGQLIEHHLTPTFCYRIRSSFSPFPSGEKRRERIDLAYSLPLYHSPDPPEEMTVCHFQHTGQHTALHTAGDLHTA